MTVASAVRRRSAAVSLALASLAVTSACAVSSLSGGPTGSQTSRNGTAASAAQVPHPAADGGVEALHAPAPVVGVGAAQPAPAIPTSQPAPAVPTDLASPEPISTEIGPGAPDSALVVPALAQLNLPPREPLQFADATRRTYPARIERWRPLVRDVLSDEWQQGTLDGLAQRIDDDLILAMIQQESQGDPQAESYVGAMGLMQVMPETFALMMAGDASLVPAIDPDAFWDPGSNIHAGVRYLALAMQNQDGNIYWSLASYNAGIGTVKRWRLAGLYAVPPFGPYTETADYAQIISHSYVNHRAGVQLYIPDPMPEEHVPGALELLRAFRHRASPPAA